MELKLMAASCIEFKILEGFSLPRCSYCEKTFFWTRRRRREAMLRDDKLAISIASVAGGFSGFLTETMHCTTS